MASRETLLAPKGVRVFSCQELPPEQPSCLCSFRRDKGTFVAPKRVRVFCHGSKTAQELPPQQTRCRREISMAATSGDCHVTDGTVFGFKSVALFRSLFKLLNEEILSFERFIYKIQK